MDGLVAGLSNKMIAREYDISPRTIEVYRANVMTKMQAGSLSELVRLAHARRRAQGLSQIKSLARRCALLSNAPNPYQHNPGDDVLMASAEPAPVIYVVDDDHRRARLAAVPAGNRRFRRAHVQSGAALLNGQRAGDADCFVIDYKMPNMNGIDLANRLRNRHVGTPDHPDHRLSRRKHSGKGRRCRHSPRAAEAASRGKPGRRAFRGAIQESPAGRNAEVRPPVNYVRGSP